MIELPSPHWHQLDFPVSLRPAFIKVDEEYQHLPNAQCVYREDTGMVLDIVSKKYQLLPHGRIFREVEKSVQKLPFSVEGVRTHVGMAGGYASVEWYFDHKIEVRPGDKVSVAFLAKNSLDRTAALTLCLSARRLICTNGLRGPGPEFFGRWRHRDSLDPDTIAEWIGTVPELVAPMLEKWREWSEHLVSLHQVTKGLESLGLSEEAQGVIQDYLQEHTPSLGNGEEPEAQLTSLWDAYNSLTWYATHRVRTRRKDLLAIRREDYHRIALHFVQEVSKN